MNLTRPDTSRIIEDSQDAGLDVEATLDSDGINRLVAEFEGVELGDSRRNARVKKLVAKLARSPSSPLPAALGWWNTA